MLGFHRYGAWVPVRYHLERECLRCPRVDVRYPPRDVMLAHVAVDLFMRYSALKRGVPWDVPVFKRRDDR